MFLKFFETRQMPYPLQDMLESRLKPQAFKIWLFDVDENPHSVSIAIGVLQTRTIQYDEEVIIKEWVGHNGGSEYIFHKEGLEFKVVYEAPFWSLRRLLPIKERLHLFIEGNEIPST